MDKKETNIKERVVQIAKEQSVSQERFFHSIGMTSANFRGNAKKTPLNSTAIANIVTIYPEVDLHWLVLGETPVTKDRSEEKAPENQLVDKTCQEKDEIIAMLKSQVQDLKTDKEDLRQLLKLARK